MNCLRFIFILILCEADPTSAVQLVETVEEEDVRESDSGKFK